MVFNDFPTDRFQNFTFDIIKKKGTKDNLAAIHIPAPLFPSTVNLTIFLLWDSVSLYEVMVIVTAAELQ